MNFKLLVAGLLVGSSMFAVAGCSVDAADPASDDADAEEAATSDADLVSNKDRLVGAFHGGGMMLPPSFYGLVFQQDGTFFADIDTGIRCIKAPCPSHVRLTGRFSATKNYLRLSPAPGQKADGFHGRYRYTLAKDELSLRRAELNRDWVNGLKKDISYCTAPVDCEGQSLIHPMCVGAWTCGETRSCAWSCGVPNDNAFWPASSTKLVAHSTSGFAPWPPPGSTCQLGQATYTYDVAAKKLAWDVCQYAEGGKPFLNAKGSKVLTAAQIDGIVKSVKSLKVSTSDICGADKPGMTVTVTSANGEKAFLDDFYACQKEEGTYVSNIGVVFGALRDVAGL